MLNEGKDITFFDYDLETGKLNLYQEDQFVTSIMPLSIIQKKINPQTKYIVSHDEQLTLFDKVGNEIDSISVWEVISVWQQTGLIEKLSKKYLGE